ncbi:MAG TPA: TonB-dependent receptor plug domain-containing protein, partial [Sphingomonadaceae bacterium]|nr:TonB-dependent receptor plug domain-containing protein [Sphingomonadaceae bacterium]
MLALPVCSQDRNDEDEPIILAHPPRATYLTVVASGDEARIDSFGQAVSIIGETEIREVQGGDIVRVLERMPGVTLARNGGPGSFTGLRVRGAEAEQLLVLVDGVAVADSASPGNGFDFGNLLPGGIGKLELLRSSNSTIWGSQAIGGVLAVESGGLHGATASL